MTVLLKITYRNITINK